MVDMPEAQDPGLPMADAAPANLPWRWRLMRRLHRWDYARLLPLMARLPLGLGYALAALRGHLNAALGRDWRSVALGTRHIHRLSVQAAKELVPVVKAAGGSRDPHAGTWAAARFRAEARDEFEAWLMHERRWPELHCRFDPPDAPQRLAAAARERGLVLLTPHFDSFYLGIAFAAQASGCTVNAMASAIPEDPRVEPAVTAHFHAKYRGLETALNGGAVVNMEDGLRPFYRMLERAQTLVVLADAPVLAGGAEMAVEFLGGPRRLAGGALRLAQRTNTPMAAFVCRHLGGPNYELRWCEAGEAHDPNTLPRLYAFLGHAIAQEPGRWWAMDMLPNLPLIKEATP
jgi:lauroyl/myristoyl acyltransferase